MKKGDVKMARNGETYVLISRLGQGGQANVWKVQNQRTSIFYAYKEYKKDPYDVKANIEDLIKIEKFKDKNGKILNDVVLPITMVDLEGKSFGYIMNLVDLKDFTNLKRAWTKGPYPSCKAICKIVQNFAWVFETLHLSYGMCYKDVNEGNIFFNPVTGDVRIIDNDNIGYSNKFTIKGTIGYMAPEIILGDRPDHNSDRFSFAVFVYRLLIGAFPFEGPYTEQYCLKNDVLPKDARKVIFGTHALFVWHPTDTRNSIKNSADPQHKIHAKFWHKLPSSVKDMFISTFVTNLPKDRRAERTTDGEWRDKFAEIEKNLVKCPNCGKLTFSETGVCFECSAPLKIESKHKVVFKILSAEEPKRLLEASVADVVQSGSVSKHLAAGKLFKILYNNKIKKLGIRNLTSSAWTIVHADKSKEVCNPGQVQILEEGMMIRIIPKTAQLNVVELQ